MRKSNWFPHVGNVSVDKIAAILLVISWVRLDSTRAELVQCGHSLKYPASYDRRVAEEITISSTYVSPVSAILLQETFEWSTRVEYERGKETSYDP